MADLVAVVMAGGRGERFWPLSRRVRPKQLLHFDGNKSLIQQAVERVLPLVGPGRVLVVTNREYAASIRDQLHPHLAPDSILVEPVGRNTAASIGLAAIHLVRTRGPWGSDPTMVVLPADHVVRDPEGFRRVVRAAAQAAEEHSLVTIGIWPTRPETGYGYIELGERAGSVLGYDVYRAARFVEKPDLSFARRFAAGGRHLWNSGMFVWKAGAILQALRRHMPLLTRGLDRIAEAWDRPERGRVVEEVFQGLESVSIDYGVMERSAPDIAVVPADFGWDDAGSWPALERLFEPDEEGNVVQGLHVGIDTGRCIVFTAADSRPRLVATLGVEDLVIVQTDDVTLVCHKDRAQEIKALLARLARSGLEAYL